MLISNPAITPAAIARPASTPARRGTCAHTFARSRPGAARTAGIVMIALVAALGIALVVVLKGFLTSPAPTQAGSPSAGKLSGPSSGGATVARGEFAPYQSTTLADAQQAIASSEFNKAAAVLTRLTEDNPDAAVDPAVNLTLAEALLGQEDYPGAYKQYEKVIAIEGKAVTPTLHFQAGTVAVKAGLLDRAVEHYSMAQSADPSRAEYPLYLAMVQLRQGETEPGIASLLRVIKLAPDTAEAYGTLAEVYLRDNKLEVAMPNIAKARELQPKVARWRIVEARILKRQAKPADALNILLAMNEEDQHRPEAVTLAAECFGMLSRPADAAELYVKAAERERANAEYHYQAALWLQRAGKPDEALASAKTASMLGHQAAKDLAGSLAAAEPK